MQNGLSGPENICLVGGSGRCGTTIVRRIFSKHPDVASVDTEMRFLIDPDGLIDFYCTFADGGWSPQLYSVSIERLRKLLTDLGRGSAVHNVYKGLLGRLGVQKLHKKFPYKAAPRYTMRMRKYCPDYSRFVEELLEKLIEFRYKGLWVGSGFLTRPELFYMPAPDKKKLAETLGDFFRNVSRSIGNSKGAKHFFEDTPWNILWFDKILELLPEAKLVHIYRDPRDVVSSFANQNWAPSDVSQAAQFYKGIMERWWEVRSQLPTGSYKEIHLEDLVSDTGAVLEDVCNFLNIRWDDSLMQTDLSHSHSGRWKKEFTNEQQEVINHILAEQIRKICFRKQAALNR